MTVITGNDIQKYRRLVLLKGLELECEGLTKRGRSCYSIIKQEFGIKGSKVKVLQQFAKIVEENK